MKRMHPWHYLTAFIPSIFIFSCGSSGGGSGGGSLSSVGNIAEAVGIWNLTSSAVKEYPNESIVSSGTRQIRIRKDGSFFTQSTAYSVSAGNTEFLTSCSGYSSGKISVSDGSYTTTENVVAHISGNCGGESVGPTTYKDIDGAGKLYRNGNSLQGELETTHLENGVSKKVTFVQTFTKSADESWDGNGLDPNFSGTFALSNYYEDYECTDTNDGSYNTEIPFSGSLKISISGSSFTSTQNALKIGSLAACTATSAGTIAPQSLKIRLNQTSVSDACADQSTDANVVTSFDRDVVGIGTKWASFNHFSYPDNSCTGGYASVKTIMIYDKQ
jgi:hypothetical protein